jgi:tripartite-type tricarboxylate transporter receptor subunit TctC
MQVVLKNPEVIKRWQEIGAESSTMTPEEYTDVREDRAGKRTAAVKASGAKPE